MRKASLSVVLGAMLVLSAAVGIVGTKAAHAGAPPNVETISVFRSSFMPSMMNDASGVVVTLVNEDSISHHIVLYRKYTRMPFEVTLSPGQWYQSPEPLTCTGSCSTAAYTYRDANLSRVDPTGYCTSFCARLWVYNTGA
jgi:hypothetical protein